jgi:hypothetical protein
MNLYFTTLLISTVKKVYIANTTDSYWFERNSIKDVQKYLQKSELAEIAGGQLESLYEKIVFLIQ